VNGYSVDRRVTPGRIHLVIESSVMFPACGKTTLAHLNDPLADDVADARLAQDPELLCPDCSTNVITAKAIAVTMTGPMLQALQYSHAGTDRRERESITAATWGELRAAGLVHRSHYTLTALGRTVVASLGMWGQGQ
jgi:hypothetical protein